MDAETIPVRRTMVEQGELEAMLKDLLECRLRFNGVIGLRVESFGPETPRLRFDMRPELTGSHVHNRLHGGAIATALDTVGGFAVTMAITEKHADESAEQIAVRLGRIGTIDLRVDYLHQGTGRSFTASAKIMRLGGRIASVRMELTNDANVLIATGTAAYVIS